MDLFFLNNNCNCYLLDAQKAHRFGQVMEKKLLLISLFFSFSPLFIIGLYLSSLYEVSWIS